MTSTATTKAAANGKTGPPQPGDNVAITLPGTYALTLDTPESIGSIVVDSSDATLVLDANLTAAGNFILDAGMIVFDGGTLSRRHHDQRRPDGQYHRSQLCRHHRVQ